MVLFAENDEIQQWADTMQDILPNNIGLALFDESGKLLGNPASLRLGDRCIADIHNFLHSKPIGIPPVHNDNKLYEHYDIVKKIQVLNDTSGLLFASFSLSPLHAEINRITETGQHIIIRTGSNMLISESNKLTNKTIDFHHRVSIKNTDWFLEASIEEENLNMLLIMIAAVDTFLFILVNLVLFGYSRRLFRLFTDDFKAIRLILMSVKKHDLNASDIKLSGLSETEEIVNNIKYLADDISQLIDFSTTDELTGIANRRAFNKEITRYLQLARRNVDITVVVIDIDYFKTANDKYGHILGDKILQILGEVLSEITRETDMCARLGGDEFVAILITCSYENILLWYQRLANEFKRRQIKQLNELTDNHDICTLSAGYTCILKTDESTERILHRADEGLYKAKADGRDNLHKNPDE